MLSVAYRSHKEVTETPYQAGKPKAMLYRNLCPCMIFLAELENVDSRAKSDVNDALP